MFAAKRYLAVSIDLTISSSSIFRAVSSEGAQKMFGLKTWRVIGCSLLSMSLCAIPCTYAHARTMSIHEIGKSMPLLNDKQFQMRASADFLARIDEWRRAQPD